MMKKLVIGFSLLLAMLCSYAYAAGNGSSVLVNRQPPSMKGASSAELIACLSDKRDMYRTAAVEELGRRKDSNAAVGLKTLLKDKIPGIRVAAAEALLGIGDASGLPVLHDTLKDTAVSPATALRAAKALAEAGDDTGVALANSQLKSEYFTNRVLAIHALNSSKNDEIAYAAFRIGLNDPKVEVKTTCLFRLGERANLKSLEMISPFLLDGNDELRVMAQNAAIRTRLWGALPLIIDTLSDKHLGMRGLAASGLNSITGHTIEITGRVADDKAASDLQEEWQKWWAENSGLHPSDYVAPKPESKPLSIQICL